MPSLNMVLKACHKFMPCCHATRSRVQKVNMLGFTNKARRVCRSQWLKHSTRRVAWMGPKSCDPVNDAIISDICFNLQNANTDMTTEKMPKCWPDAASALFAILEVQFRLHRIKNLGQCCCRSLSLWRSPRAYVRCAIHQHENDNYTPNQSSKAANQFQADIDGAPLRISTTIELRKAGEYGNDASRWTGGYLRTADHASPLYHPDTYWST